MEAGIKTFADVAVDLQIRFFNCIHENLLWDDDGAVPERNDGSPVD